jgi:protein kinase-like protein
MFMAPEQARGESVDHRADLFSLGSVLYAMCTGHPPFRAAGTHAVLMRVIEDTPRPIQESNPELPDWLGAIIAKLHAKKPEDRFQTAQEVAELLEQYLAHVQQPSVAPRPAPLAPAAAPEGAAVVLHKLLDATDAWRRPLQHLVFVVGLLAAMLGVMLGVGNPYLHDLGWTLAAIGGLFLVSAAVIRQRWIVDYRGHQVRFESSFFFGESLFIDERRVDRGRRRQLRGRIDAEPGRGDEVVAWAEINLRRVRCRIDVERTPVRAGLAESVVPAPRSAPAFPWGRLGWMSAAYTLAACVLFVFIAAYSDNGWWPTPWIEFSAASALFLLAVAHLFVRPRWLAILPLPLAIFFAALGWVLWPYSTARYFTRQVHNPILTRGHVRANRMLTSGPWVYRNAKLIVPAKDGNTVSLSDDDYPLDAYDADLDRFLEQNEDGAFRFRITTKWAQDRYCELKMVAGHGTVSCEAISFHRVTDNADPGRRKVHPITQEEWMRERGLR